MEQTEHKMHIQEGREWMKANPPEGMSDQKAGLPQPSLCKDCGDTRISLTREFSGLIRTSDILTLIGRRSSKRSYTEESLTQAELAFLLWSCQGVKAVIGKERKATLRTVPSAGARHPLETYLWVNLVEGLRPGLYHYHALDHALEFIGEIENQQEQVSAAFGGQTFFGQAPVSFVWTAVPYRSEWRYQKQGPKYVLLDAGHACENLYLAAEAIGCGACGVGAYHQQEADRLLRLSSGPSSAPENEFVVYAAAVGRVTHE